MAPTRSTRPASLVAVVNAKAAGRFGSRTSDVSLAAQSDAQQSRDLTEGVVVAHDPGCGALYREPLTPEAALAELGRLNARRAKYGLPPRTRTALAV